MRLVHYKISCFILQLQDRTILMTLGLQNHIRTSVMPRIIRRKNLQQLPLRVCYSRDHRHLVFIHSFIHITATVNRVFMIMHLH